MRSFLYLIALAAAPASAQVTLGGAGTFTLGTTAATYTFGPGLVVGLSSSTANLVAHTVQAGMTGGGSFGSGLTLNHLILNGSVALTPGDSVRVEGDVTCPSGVLSGGTLRLEGGATQTLGAGCSFPRVSIDKTGGEVLLGGDVTLSDALRLTDDTLRIGAFTLTVGGHVTGSALARIGTLALNGTADQHVAGRFYLDGVVVNKPTGGVVLDDDLDVRGPLTLTSGNLDLNGRAVEMVGGTALLTEAGGRVFGTSGTIATEATLNVPNAVDAAGLGAEITSNANLGLTRIVRGHAVQTGNGNPSIARYYDISPATNSGLDALLVFRYRDDELNGLAEGTLKLFRSTDGGTSWTERGGTVSVAGNSITLSGVDGFSRWTAGENGTLPVELVAFSATQTGDSRVTLRWTTASETNNAAFLLDVQGLGETTWREAARLNGYGTTTEQHDYAFAVDGLEAGRYRFRLRQLDTDGTLHVHDAVEAFVGMTDAVRVRVAGPNPARGTTALALAVRDPQRVTVSVVDVTGRERLRVETAELSGSQTIRIPLDVSGWGTGTYFVRVVGEGFAPLLRLVVGR